MTIGRRAWGLGLLAGATAACIIPDAGLVVEDEFLNVGAVRLVEPTPISPRADLDCENLTSLNGCPRVPQNALPSGLIEPESPLCVCPQGRDFGLGGFDLLVEDPDVDEEGDPKDDIFGALLLDMPANAPDPDRYLAYASLLPPDVPAARYRAVDVQTIERPDPHLKAWALAGQARIDLCNDNDGTALTPGLHQIQVIVTDRPWYRPLARDDQGAIVLDEEGDPVFGDPLIGVPDLAIGATYDTTFYVFECFDANDPPEGIECNCEP